MAALSVDGTPMPALPNSADQINYDNTTSGLSATTVKGAVDELASEKQDATDDNLTTTDKTIVGGINELKSGLTTLDTEVNGDATVYPYADVITIEDAVPSNLADCSVKIEPVQDLHGYDKPWVGGAGKNKAYVNINSGETALTEIKDNDNNVIGVNADVGAAGVVVTVKMATVSIENGKTYTLSGSPNDKGNNTYRLDVRTQAQGQLYNNWNEIDNPTITATADVTLDIYLRIAANYAVNNLVFHPQIEEGNQATTFAPYTNICPISGHTEASVQRDGKNLCSELESGTLNDHGLNTDRNGRVRTKYYIRVVEGQQYVLRALPSVSGKVVNIAFNGFTKDDYATYRIYDSGWLANGSYITIPSGVKFVRCVFKYATEDNITPSSFEDVQLELGSTATPYVPYAGKTYTIALGDTIYGGTVDFDSGVMTVDRAIIDLSTLSYYEASTNVYAISDPISNIKAPASNDNVANCLCENYEVVSRNGQTDLTLSVNVNGRVVIADSRFSTKTDFVNSLNGVHLCYELATPTTIQLTPQQIQLLKGTNTLYASTGQISVTANGVSGAIGSVQEQVNDHEERIEAVESGLIDLAKHNLDSTVIDITSYISGNTYTTPSDGFVRVSASTEAINVVRKNGTAFCILTGTGTTELSAFVKKGTQLFVDNPSTAKFLPYID